MSRVMTGRPPKLTPEEAIELRAWAAYGTSVPEVARRKKLSPETVRRYIACGHKRPELRRV